MKNFNVPSSEKQKYPINFKLLLVISIILGLVVINETVEKQNALKALKNLKDQNKELTQDNNMLSQLNSQIDEDFSALSQMYALLESDYEDLSSEQVELHNRIFELIGENADINDIITLLLNPRFNGIDKADHFDLLIRYIQEANAEPIVKEGVMINLITSYLERSMNVGYKDDLGDNQKANLLGLKDTHIKPLTGEITFEYESGNNNVSLYIPEGSSINEVKEYLVLYASDLTLFSNGVLKFDVSESDDYGVTNLYLSVNTENGNQDILHIMFENSLGRIYSISTPNFNLLNAPDENNQDDWRHQFYDDGGRADSNRIVEA